MVRVSNNKEDKVISFIREKNDDRVLAVFNFSDGSVEVSLKTEKYSGVYTEIFSEIEHRISGSVKLTLEPWGYQVLSTT
jgi:hypothetical protein